jgi:hypothetical protein
MKASRQPLRFARCALSRWAGFVCFLGMAPSTFKRYRDRDEFCTVISAIENVMRTQKFEAAAAGLLNANLISRDLGLADKAQIGGDPDNQTPVPIGLIELVPGVPKQPKPESAE